MNPDLPDKERANILLVDDQPAKLMSYELILEELGQNIAEGLLGEGSAGNPAQDTTSPLS